MEANAEEEKWATALISHPDYQGEVYARRAPSVFDMLRRTAERLPDGVGFMEGERKVTYREFMELVGRAAGGFASLGVGKGDRVSLLMGIGVDFTIAFFAAQKLGAIAVPLNTRFKGEELAYEINDSESKIIVVDEDLWGAIAPALKQLTTVSAVVFNGEAAPHGTVALSSLTGGSRSAPQCPVNETDTALILYTSGTTGRPKGAVLHHRGLITTAMNVARCLDLGPDDKYICCVPLFHVTGLAMIVLASVFAGAPCLYVRTFKAGDFLALMARERVTRYTGVINILWMMINHPNFDRYDLGSLNTALLGGSPATEEMVKGINTKLPNLHLSVGYGLTEAHGISTGTPFDEALRKIKAVGLPMPLVQAKIELDGVEMPVEGVGEVMLRGPMITRGYWKNEGATAAAVTPDGWLHTGDIGKIDAEGYVYILDRMKDVVNRGGEKIFCLEVENVLMEFPDVMEVAIVSVPDTVMGEAVKAALVVREGANASAEAVREFCRAKLADYKIPKYVQFYAALPRNPAGKIIKAELKTIPS